LQLTNERLQIEMDERQTAEEQTILLRRWPG